MSDADPAKPVEPNRPRLNPQDLPPVTPPSASFIAQLFLVPALIVLVIVGLWLVVNRLARSEQDWRALLIEVQSANEHLRWRGAFGLAQLLQADQELTGGQRLVENPEVAREMRELLETELRSHPTGGRDPDAPDEEVADSVNQQAFLARSLGLFHLPQEVLPGLLMAAKPEQHRMVRKNALEAIAVLAGRALEAKQPLDDAALIEEMIQLSAEPVRDRTVPLDPRKAEGQTEVVQDALIPQLATFNLGLLPSPASTERLESLLNHADDSVRTNAAIGLARQGSTAGLGTLQDLLQEAEKNPGTPGSNEEFRTFLGVKNALHALEILSPHLSADQRTRCVELLQPIAKSFPEPRLRVDAERVLLDLQTGSSKQSG